MYFWKRPGCGIWTVNFDGVGEAAAIAGVLASAAGAGTQIVAGQDEKNKMNQAVASQLAQQQQYQKQGQSLVNENIAQNTAPQADKDISAGTNNALSEYAKVNAIPLTTSSSNGAIGGAQGKDSIIGQDASNKVGLNNSSAAPLQGYNDWQVQQWIKNLQTNTGLSQIQRNSQNSASVLPLQLQSAQNSENGLSGFGSLLNTGGGLLGTYGATRPVSSNAYSGTGLSSIVNGMGATPLGSMPNYSGVYSGWN